LAHYCQKQCQQKIYLYILTTTATTVTTTTKFLTTTTTTIIKAKAKFVVVQNHNDINNNHSKGGLSRHAQQTARGSNFCPLWDLSCTPLLLSKVSCCPTFLVTLRFSSSGNSGNMEIFLSKTHWWTCLSRKMKFSYDLFTIHVLANEVTYRVLIFTLIIETFKKFDQAYLNFGDPEFGVFFN